MSNPAAINLAPVALTPVTQDLTRLNTLGPVSYTHLTLPTKA